MPYDRPGKIFYATATKAVVHNLPVIEKNVPGVAIKQKTEGAAVGAGTGQKTVQIGENFAIKKKGIVQVPTVGGFAKGDAVYIHAADNTLNETNTDVPYGTVVEIAGERGTPVGFCRIDLDQKPDKIA